MDKRFVLLDTPERRAVAARIAHAAPQGWVAQFGEPTRTSLQNAKLWPMLADVRAQVEDFGRFSQEDMKLRFMSALGAEMRFLPELEGAGMFPVGLRSSTLTKTQFAALIELIYATGSRHDVRWSEPNPYQEQAA